MGLLAGVAAACGIIAVARDGTLASRLNTQVGAWSFAAGGALLLLVLAQGWPRFAAGFCPVAGAGAVIAAILDRTVPHHGPDLLPPMLVLGATAVAATFQAFGWERAIRTGRRS